MGSELKPVRGNPPSLLKLPTGCSFHPRCDYMSRVPGERCVTELPEFLPVPGEPGRLSRCHLADPASIFAAEIEPNL